MNPHYYRLQPYAGMQTRHTCPSCGRKRCFTLYIDPQGQPLSDTVGRCDHESSCGYHYTPADYYRDHPTATAGNSLPPQAVLHRHTPAPDALPWDIVRQSVRPDIHSTLTTYLSTIIDPGILERTILNYHLGVTKDRSVIYFQIDTKGRCRTGKIMKYDPATGHRIKDPDTPSKITWVHSILKTRKQLPADWQLTQCLFGEHLLPLHPDSKVALVESEKTAIICSCLIPGCIWLATGGKTQLGEKLLVLKGREVIAFPDIDAYDTWKERLSLIPGLTITVSDYLQRSSTPEDLAAHIDIADLLLRDRNRTSTPQEKHDDILKYFSPQYRSDISLLISELDLIPVSITTQNHPTKQQNP